LHEQDPQKVGYFVMPSEARNLSAISRSEKKRDSSPRSERQSPGVTKWTNDKTQER
jgi:hypothetical protein